MQRWGYGCNNLYKTCGLYLEEAPWWVFALTEISPLVCNLIPAWRIPLLGRLKVERDGDTHAFWDWYGDIQQIWCVKVDMPITQWAYSLIKCTTVEIDWEHGKSLFYAKDQARWDEWESDPEFGTFAEGDEHD